MLQQLLQCGAVGLATAAHWQLPLPDKTSRQHAGRQFFCQQTAQLSGVVWLPGSIKRHQLLVAAVIGQQHLCLVNAGQRQQLCLDFAGLNTLAVQLQLQVSAADVFDVAIGTVTAEIAGLVQPCTGMALQVPRVVDKSRCAQRRLPVITVGQLHAADNNLAGYARWQRLQLRINNVQACIGQRFANRHMVAVVRLAAVKIADINTGLGWPVQVVQATVRQLADNTLCQWCRQCLAAAKQQAQRITAGKVGVFAGHRQH